MRAYGCVKRYEARNDDILVGIHPRTGRRYVAKAARVPAQRHLKKRARRGVAAALHEAHVAALEAANEWGCESPWCQCRFCEDYPWRDEWEPFLAAP